MSKIKLGQQVVVSDPCYTIPTWCQAVVDGVKPGTYESYVKKVDLNDWGVRCSMLIAVHEDYRDGVLRWEEYPADIGVDSGQCGIFSSESYRNDSITERIGFGEGDISFFKNFGRPQEDGEKWYVSMCSRTLGNQSYGMYDEGVVSSSGIGDGSYVLYVAKVGNEIVGLCVDFLVEEDEVIDFGFYKDPEYSV